MNPGQHPGYHFDGKIQVTDERGFQQGYLQCPFEVPPGVGALRIRFSYRPVRVGRVPNLITLSLFDPHGPRGNAHRKPPDRETFLAPELASAGFTPGPIYPGLWLAQLALHAVLRDEEVCTYTLDIDLLAGEKGAVATWQMPAAEIVRPEPGWYRGELHCHTLHSDGDISPHELIQRARLRGLDFLAITDHNTLSELGEISSTAQEGLLIIPGMELTTFNGHALTLGIDRWVDWRTGYNGWRMEDAARITHEIGGLFIVAHPNDFGSPVCTGCKWEYADFDLHLADGIEVWNGGWWGSNDKNPKALQLWRSLQSDERPIFASAGTDTHTGEWDGDSPLTYVYAANLSVDAILEGLRRGQVMLSSGPWLNLQAAPTQGEPVEIGGVFSAGDGMVNLLAQWENAPEDARLEIHSSQEVLASAPAGGSGSLAHAIWAQAGQRFWLELYTTKRKLLAITNPVTACA